MTHAAEHDGRAADERGRQRDRQRVAGADRATCAAAGANRVRSSAAARNAGGDEGERQRHPVLVGAERGDEHEQHRAGHERLAAGSGVEGERVGGEHGERRADRRPAAPSRRRTRPGRRRAGTGRARGRGRPTRCPTSRASGRWRRTSPGRTTHATAHDQRERRVTAIDSSAWTCSRRSSSDEPWPTTTMSERRRATNSQSANTRANPRAATNE